MTQGWSFLFLFLLFFLWWILAHAELRAAQSPPRRCPPLWSPSQAELGWVAGGSKQQPPPTQAAGPSPSGEPSGSWRCGAAGQRGGLGAAGSPCWGWGPWDTRGKVENFKNNKAFTPLYRVTAVCEFVLDATVTWCSSDLYKNLKTKTQLSTVSCLETEQPSSTVSVTISHKYCAFTWWS